MTEPNLVNIRAWINALRSGDYSQTTQVLKNERGYCCLGVATEISGLCEWLPLDVGGVTFEAVAKGILDDPHNRTGILHPAVMKWLGVPNADIDLIDEKGSESAATGLNDYEGYTFNQIADALERTFPDA